MGASWANEWPIVRLSILALARFVDVVTACAADTLVIDPHQGINAILAASRTFVAGPDALVVVTVRWVVVGRHGGLLTV
jgi:hypothetical protein